MLSSYPWNSTGIRGFSQISVDVISVSVDVRVRLHYLSVDISQLSLEFG